MAFRDNSIRASNYYDNNGTALVKAGTNVSVAVAGTGGFTVSASGSGKYVVGFITTTNASSTVTVNISAYGFTSTPVFSASALNASTSQCLIANVSAISTTSITINTFTTQNTPILIGGTSVPVALAPNVTVHVQLVQQ